MAKAFDQQHSRDQQRDGHANLTNGQRLLRARRAWTRAAA